MSSLYKVAIVGRINVGKSTLFNKLIADNKAITSAVAGTTRDRNYAICSWRNLDFYLIDTGGLEKSDPYYSGKKLDNLDEKIFSQAQQAIDDADLILFVVDAKTGVMPADRELIKKIKKQKKPCILAVNKADNQKLRQQTAEFYQLSLDKPWPVSAANGSGTGDLLDEIVAKLNKIKKHAKSLPETKNIKVAIVGKPNVGKSSLINAILGEDRVIVSSAPHTTRDAQDIEFNWKKQNITLIDTAGIRRHSKKSSDAFEKQSIMQSIMTIQRADIVILVTDVSQKLSWQDKHLINEAISAGAGLIILANKWDLIENKDTDTVKLYDRYYKSFIPFVSWAPIIYSSALHKTRINKILDTILHIYEEKNKNLTDNTLDKLLKNIIKKHKPSRGKGTKQPYIYNLKQIASNPPVFAIKMNFKADLHDSYLRFIENNLRYKFGFEGVPIKIRVIKSQNTKDIS